MTFLAIKKMTVETRLERLEHKHARHKVNILTSTEKLLEFLENKIL